MTGQDLIEAIQRCHMEHKQIDSEESKLVFELAKFENQDDEDDIVYVEYVIDMATGAGRLSWF